MTRPLDTSDERDRLLNDDAIRVGIEQQKHDASFFETVKLHSPAVFWSLFFGLGVIMVGFDNNILGQLYATPAFRRDFGHRYGETYVLPARWMSALSICNLFGQIIGSLTAAHPMEYYGRKKTFGACVILTAGCVAIQFSAKSLRTLLIGDTIGGLVLGAYIVIAPAYASEVCPLALRGVLTSCTNIFFVIGQLLSSCVVTATSRLDNHWAYSLPFALQWVWPAVILIGLPFAPESPWWLQRQNRIEAAEDALKQLASAQITDVKPTLRLIIETDKLEQKLEAGTTYWDCFVGVNARRTEIASGVYCLQILSGIYLAGYMTYFFELAGIPTTQAFTLNIGFLVFGFLGTCVSWPLIVRYSRRSMYIVALAVLAGLQFIVAIIDCSPGYASHPAFAWSQAFLMLTWNFVYGASLGPLCFVLMCEVPATRLKSKTIAIATAVQGLLGAFTGAMLPYLFNPDQINAQGKVGFIFGTTALLSLVWAWFKIPEMSGRSERELDILFERKVKTREFQNYKIEEE